MNSIPGLFVEEFPHEDLTSDVLSIKVQQKNKSSCEDKTVTATEVLNNATVTTTNNVPHIDLTQNDDDENIPPNQTNGGLSLHTKTEKSQCNTSSHSNDNMDDSVELMNESFGTQGKNYRYDIQLHIVSR